MIKAIVFDLDGVYFKNGKKNFMNNVSRKYNIPREEVKYVFLKSDEMNKYYKTGKISGDEFWKWATDVWEIEATKDELIELLGEGYEINQEAVDLCRKLRKNGYKTLVCSNNFKERIEILQKRFGFMDDFDVCIFSCDVGTLKPNKRIFEILCEKANVKPSEVFLVDDDERIISSAKKFGFHTSHCTNLKEFVNDLRDAGVKVD